MKRRRSRVIREAEVSVQSSLQDITPIAEPRSGWADIFQQMVERNDDSLLDGVVPTLWDETGWEW